MKEVEEVFTELRSGGVKSIKSTISPSINSILFILISFFHSNHHHTLLHSPSTCCNTNTTKHLQNAVLHRCPLRYWRSRLCLCLPERPLLQPSVLWCQRPWRCRSRLPYSESRCFDWSHFPSRLRC